MVNTERFKKLIVSAPKTQTLTKKIKTTANFFERFKKDIIEPAMFYSEINMIQYNFYKQGIDFDDSYLLSIIELFKNKENYNHEFIAEIKTKIVNVLGDYVDELEPYLQENVMEPDKFKSRFNAFTPYRSSEGQITSITALLEIFGGYNKQLLTDFFNQCDKFPDQPMIKEYCDHRIEFLEQIRLLIELVL